MAVVVIGFLAPIFSIFGGHIKLNGFDLVGKGDSAMKIAALFIFLGAVTGIILQFVKNNSLYKLVALIITLAGGLYCYFNTSDIGIKIASKFLSTGFYMIVIGWCIALTGWLLCKK